LEEDDLEDDLEDDHVKGEEEDDVETDGVEGEEVDDTEDADVEDQDRSQDRAACFVRACTVEMHINMSQEPLYTEIYRKSARHTLSASLRSRNAIQHFARATWYGNLKEKCRAPD